MLAAAPIVAAVAGLARAGRLPRLVVDPVMVASSGDRLLEPAAERVLAERLLPFATVVTPNLHEAEALLGAPIRTLDDQREAARTLGSLGPRVAVVTGGEPLLEAGGEAIDVMWDGSAVRELRAPRIDTSNDHGTGCTFAAATAAALAGGATAGEAVASAKRFMARAVAGGATWRLGRGHGPLDHFAWAQPAPTGASRSPVTR
jgi:hydroxymethylpyrimidine/phosphomethylpyrimidine kinase